MSKYEQLYNTNSDFSDYVHRNMKTYNKSLEDVLQLAIVRFYGDSIIENNQEYNVDSMIMVLSPNER